MVKKNFLFLNFCTEYASVGTINKEMDRESCFGTIFNSTRKEINQDNKYTLRIYKIGDKLNKEALNNACLVNRDGIVHHLNIAKSIFKFSYHLKEYDDSFVLTIHYKGNLIYHKFILSWVRYLYEYPFNVFLQDANRLKKLPEFRFESIINLFNLVGATSGINDHGVSIHAIGDTEIFKELLTTKQIQDKLKTLRGKNTRINDIFNGYYEKGEYPWQKIKDSIFESIEEGEDRKLHSSSYWDSNREFTKRLKLYRKNYKILQERKKKAK